MESCPQNVDEWNEAASRKGCENISHSCNSSSFEYHCVINPWGNETIEVCAPSLTIVGKNAIHIIKCMHINVSVRIFIFFKPVIVQLSYKSLFTLLFM